jgi:hypothetical protein
MKIRLEKAKLFHTDDETDGQTDMTKAIDAFPEFCELAQNPRTAIYNLRDRNWSLDEDSNQMPFARTPHAMASFLACSLPLSFSVPFAVSPNKKLSFFFRLLVRVRILLVHAKADR